MHERIYSVVSGCLNEIESSLASAEMRHRTPALAKEYIEKARIQGDMLVSVLHNYFDVMKDDSLITKTFRHEVKNHIGFNTAYETYFEDGVENVKPSDIEEYVSLLKIEINVNRDLLKILRIGSLTQEELGRNSERFDLGRVIEEETYSAQSHLENRGLYLNNKLGHSDTNVYSTMAGMAALLSIHTGDALKWAPYGTTIGMEVKRDAGDLVLNWENQYGETCVNPDIGLNEGIGTEFTDGFLEAIGGRMEQYDSSRIAPSSRALRFGDLEATLEGDNVFGKEIRIPYANLVAKVE